MLDANCTGDYVGGIRRVETKHRPVKAKMYSFTTLDRPSVHMDDVMKELETQSQYVLYYRMDVGYVGVVQLSRGVYITTLQREYENFIWRRVKSDEMLSRIGWIHRNKLNVIERGHFSRRCVVKDERYEDIKHRYFYDPDTGRVSKFDDNGVKVPVVKDVLLESETEIDEP